MRLDLAPPVSDVVHLRRLSQCLLLRKPREWTPSGCSFGSALARPPCLENSVAQLPQLALTGPCRDHTLDLHACFFTAPAPNFMKASNVKRATNT